MGYAEYDIKVALEAGDAGLKERVAKVSGLRDFTYHIVRKSLDARRKDAMVWQYRVGVESPALKSGQAPEPVRLPLFKRNDRPVVAVVGTGPAGMFAADYLARCGWAVEIFERGSPVEDRAAAIRAFESGGELAEANNYSFGEGGAGTFSDGKLSSRTKSISLERDWIFQRFVAMGAPAEIAWLTHPHVGSDRLYDLTRRFREQVMAMGATLHFDTPVTDLRITQGRVTGVETSKGIHDCQAVIMATGHSAFETTRMLIRRGVPFQAKNFAIGFRAEHRQEIINRAQWGVASLPGVKAAEYRLTSQADPARGVYSFCMCPGGKVVPAAAYRGTNTVNGMSNYQRDSPWANAAVVAGVQAGEFTGGDAGALQALDWLEALERSWYAQSPDYRAPAMSIADFLAGKAGTLDGLSSSHPIGLVPADLAQLLPASLVASLRAGLADFCRTLKGYDQGLLLGLESKTSSPVQACRKQDDWTAGYPNIYLAGEGAGWAGGIVSSAADGLRAAMALAQA